MRPTPRMTSTERTHFALTLVALGMVAVVATCSCAGSFALNARSPAQQHQSSVKITVYCMPVTEDGEPTIDALGLPIINGHYGSGTLLSAHEVLTAAHVQHCPEGNLEIMHVDPGDGKYHLATTDVLLPESDVARIHVDDDLGTWFEPVAIGPLPEIGDRLCAASAAPRSMYRCWTAQQPSSDADGGIGLDGNTEFGESGSAVFNAHGQLVGVLVALTRCQAGAQCLGHASSVTAYPWLIP